MAEFALSKNSFVQNCNSIPCSRLRQFVPGLALRSTAKLIAIVQCCANIDSNSGVQNV